MTRRWKVDSAGWDGDGYARYSLAGVTQVCKADARLIEAAPSLADALEPFVNIKDQAPQTIKLIDKKLDGLTPVTITVTKAQFLAAFKALRLARGEEMV